MEYLKEFGVMDILTGQLTLNGWRQFLQQLRRGHCPFAHVAHLPHVDAECPHIGFRGIASSLKSFRSKVANWYLTKRKRYIFGRHETTEMQMSTFFSVFSFF